MSRIVDDTMTPKLDFVAATALTHLAMAPSTTKDTSDSTDKVTDSNHVQGDACKSFTGKNAKFPMKLMLLLDSEEYADILEWTPHGRSFVIKDQEAFSSRVLHHHFKAGKYSSFVRKLYRWNFSRILRGNNHGAFYNEKFLKGKYNLCKQIKACHARPPEVSYNVQTNIEDRNNINNLPAPFDGSSTSSIHLPPYLNGSSNNVAISNNVALNTAYQPILSRIPNAVSPCNSIQQTHASPSAPLLINNSLMNAALASCFRINDHQPVNLGLNSPRPVSASPLHSLDQVALSHLINNATQRNTAGSFPHEKVSKAMELMIALGL